MADLDVVFVDTAYFVALLDKRDAFHKRALALAKKLADLDSELVSSDAVVLELAGYFARSPLRVQAISWIEAIRASPGWDVAPVDPELMSRAEVRYRVHSDKNWSLADCIGMELMSARGIRAVATTDRGFAQAGFRVLLR